MKGLIGLERLVFGVMLFATSVGMAAMKEEKEAKPEPLMQVAGPATGENVFDDFSGPQVPFYHKRNVFKNVLSNVLCPMPLELLDIIIDYDSLEIKGECTHTFTCESKRIKGIVSIGSGRFITLAANRETRADDGVLRVWDLHGDALCYSRIFGQGFDVFKIVSCWQKGFFATGSITGMITIWGMKVINIGKFKKINMIRVKTIDGCSNLGGRLIDLTACYDGRLAWCADRFIQLWNWQDEESKPRKIVIPEEKWASLMYAGKIADCGDGGLALSGDSNKCWIADVRDGIMNPQGPEEDELAIIAEVQQSPCSSGVLALPGGLFTTSALSYPSAEVKAARQMVTFWDMRDIKLPANPQVFVVPLYMENEGIVYPCCMAYLNRGKGILATGSMDGKIRLYDSDSFLCLKTIDAEESVSSLCFIPEEGALISGHEDGSVRVWQ